MTRTKDAKNWPVEREEQLRQMWDVDGLSSGDIAWRMGLTRNAVIGKVSRLHLSKRKSRVQPKIKPVDRRRSGDSSMVQRLRRSLAPSPFVLPGDTARLRGSAWAALPDAVPVPLLDLVANMCRWPIGDTKPFMFCGVPCEGPYCDHHSTLAYRSVQC